ncbi:MAG: hypothetical protein LBI05_01160, partial [Planctomycetaceae bacterium]|nr:hypothetical protein [Planctomycetaceae bacterium]
ENLTPGFFGDSWSGDPEFRAALGVSEEYYQKIRASERDAWGSLSENPEYQELLREFEGTFRTVWGVEPGSNAGMNAEMREERERIAGAEALNRLRELGASIELKEQEFLAGANKREREAFDNALTPELKQKFQEIPLAVMASGETSPLFPSAFEALNLTDAQRKQMEQIKKELEPEFEKHLEICADAHLIMFAKYAEAFKESIRAAREAELRGEDGQKARRETERRFLIEDSEYQAVLDKVNSSTKAFARLFTTRMSEILTDAQRKRLQDLVDNPPEYVRIHIQKLRRARGERTGTSEEGENKGTDGTKDIWTPGPDSWKPGDPLPEVLRDKEGNFPRPTE